MPNKRGREFFDGWLSTPGRTFLLVVGWLLVLGGFAGFAYGLVTRHIVILAAGAAASFLAWLLAAFMPEPMPAPRAEVRDRLEAISKLAGHQLPV